MNHSENLPFDHLNDVISGNRIRLGQERLSTLKLGGPRIQQLLCVLVLDPQGWSFCGSDGQFHVLALNLILL
jgi:hypothetical protein